MTTKHSSHRELMAQASNIAQMLKAAERGEPIDVRFAQKIAEARNRSSIVFAIAMDDKVIKVDMPWVKIKETTEVGLTDWIFDQMREARNVAN